MFVSEDILSLLVIVWSSLVLSKHRSVECSLDERRLSDVSLLNTFTRLDHFRFNLSSFSSFCHHILYHHPASSSLAQTISSSACHTLLSLSSRCHHAAITLLPSPRLAVAHASSGRRRSASRSKAQVGTISSPPPFSASGWSTQSNASLLQKICQSLLII